MKYLILICLLGLISCRTYYDGEGNRIPGKAIKLLVRSQFIKTDSAEKVLLGKYFYNPRIQQLVDEGWSEKAAFHIVEVESGLIPVDEEYRAYMED